MVLQRRLAWRTGGCSIVAHGLGGSQFTCSTWSRLFRVTSVSGVCNSLTGWLLTPEKDTISVPLPARNRTRDTTSFAPPASNTRLGRSQPIEASEACISKGWFKLHLPEGGLV